MQTNLAVLKMRVIKKWPYFLGSHCIQSSSDGVYTASIAVIDKDI